VKEAWAGIVLHAPILKPGSDPRAIIMSLFSMFGRYSFPSIRLSAIFFSNMRSKSHRLQASKYSRGFKAKGYHTISHKVFERCMGERTTGKEVYCHAIWRDPLRHSSGHQFLIEACHNTLTVCLSRLIALWDRKIISTKWHWWKLKLKFSLDLQGMLYKDINALEMKSLGYMKESIFAGRNWWLAQEASGSIS